MLAGILMEKQITQLLRLRSCAGLIIGPVIIKPLGIFQLKMEN